MDTKEDFSTHLDDMLPSPRNNLSKLLGDIAEERRMSNIQAMNDLRLILYQGDVHISQDNNNWCVDVGNMVDNRDPTLHVAIAKAAEYFK